MRPLAKKNNQVPRSARPNSRVEARVSTEQKRFFTLAAEIRGVSFTDFVVSSLQEAAVKTVEEHNVMKLRVEEQRVFVDTLLNPPAPNESLRKAAARLDHLVDR